MRTAATFEIDYVQFLGEDGRLLREDLPEFATEERVSLARFATIRLRQDGADRWAAGLSDETRVLFIRAQRNHAAGLLDDFAEDRWRLAHLLDAIELHLRNRKP